MNEFLATLQGGVLALYSKLIHRTSPQTIEGWEHVEAALAREQPIIFTSWHGQIHLLYAVYSSHFKWKDAFLMIVGDWRESLLRHFARFVGATPFPVDMQDDSMAAARNLLRLIKQLQPGTFSYISPDGPDGPARVAKPGITFLAERASALIVPIACHARHSLHVPRWDRYYLPLPFDRIYAAVRPALEVDRSTPRDEFLETLTQELNFALEQVKALADT